MERFGGRHDFETTESKIEFDNVDWVYEKKDGRWQLLPERKIQIIAIGDDMKEQQRRRDNFMRMYEETAKQWELDDSTVEHNEGYLREHPRYKDLFEKWAMRWLRLRGFDTSKYNGKIHQDEGQLEDLNGRPTRTWLVNAVANGREIIDEWIEMELRISEGFMDITHNEERRAELGLEEPEYGGWWTADEL